MSVLHIYTFPASFVPHLKFIELVAVYVFTGVDVLATEMFSGSVSESRTFKQTGCFLFKGAISLSISFWFQQVF